MDYLNPTSIAQMAQVPKDTSLPGTGYGLVQGFNEGQAMERAKDFLDMSKAAQAQNYVKNQFDMQTAWEDYPLAREQKQANLAQTQSSTKVNQETLAKMAREAKQFGMEGQLSIMAAMRDQMREAKTPMERAALYHSTLNRMRQGGFEPDEDLLNINPMDERQAQSLIDYYDTAHNVTTYNNETRRKLTVQNEALKSQEWQTGANIASKEREGDKDRANNLERARIIASRQNRGMTQAEYMGSMDEDYLDILAKQKEGAKLTAKEQAVLEFWPRARTSAFETASQVTNNPEVQGDVAGNKKIEELRALLQLAEEMKKKREGGGKKEEPMTPPVIKPLPNQKPIVPDVDDDFNKRLNKYAPK